MNKIFTHPSQPQMQAEVILGSKHPEMENPLITIRQRLPRIIWPEELTHRVFSRNARSSRAVPVGTMLNEVRETPFIPWHWGKNQKGMQANEECNALVGGEGVSGYDHFDNTFDGISRESAWKHAAKCAVQHAQAFDKAGYHKQIVNRLLEPFSWIDVLITSNQWQNFFWLRDHKDAEPHLQDLARLTMKAIHEASYQNIEHGDWHLPYITDEDVDFAIANCGGDGPAYNWLCKISAARCARISYKPFDGDASYERELERYNMLVTSERVHASPLEHQATPDKHVEYYHCPQAADGTVNHGNAELLTGWANPHLHGNLPGWQQFRKFVPNEAVMETA